METHKEMLHYKEYICTGDGTGLEHWHSAAEHPD